MSSIKKISKLNNVGNYISNFFDGYDFDSTVLPNRTFETIMCIGDNDKNNSFIMLPEDCVLKRFDDQKLIDDLNNVIQYLKELYNIHYIWAVAYPPNDGLRFHTDDYQRYVLTFNSNSRFFNYEIRQGDSLFILEKKYNKKITSMPIDEFNQIFINETGNEIKSLDGNSIYAFNDSSHNFYNGSNKIRFILVFDIYQ
jgi:hypothetical protein